MLDILMTTYNNPEELGLSLSSLVAQTNQDFKVTIVDDCSEADYTEVINHYSKFLDINYVKNETNLGVGLSRQTGVDNSHEDYFIFFDSDDRLMPYAVQLIYDEIKKDNYPDMIVCKFHTQVTPEEQKESKSDHRVLQTKDPKRVLVWCHGKIYKREAIERYFIRLPKKYSRLLDDYYWNLLCAYLFDTQYSCNYSYYLWVQNEKSITHNRKIDEKYLRDFSAEAILEIAKIARAYKKPIEGHVLQKLEEYVKADDGVPATIEAIKEFLEIYSKK